MGYHEHSLDGNIPGEYTRQAILALLYFEVFSYPLTVEEIIECTAFPKDQLPVLRDELEKLEKAGLLHCIEGYYLTQNRPDWVIRRVEGNRKAVKYRRIAFRMARLIAFFPYVRAVFVSGSLSKNWMSDQSDIDYFIITRPGRLWLSRTALVLFKKIFLLNSHKYFCVNYFVDEEHLEIDEKNHYTATEIVTLLPVYGRQYYPKMLKANRWTNAYYPHFPARSSDHVPAYRKNLFQRLSETLLDNRAGEWLDDFCMKKTVSYWQRKFGDYDPEIRDIALKSRKYVSKHHPAFYQGKVLKAYEDNIRRYEYQTRLALQT